MRPDPQPGDSWLDVTAAGARRCLGCAVTGPTTAALVHVDGCPIARRIEAALFAFQMLGDPDGDATSSIESH